MPVRAVEGKLPYTGGEAISIDENKVISLNLRDENNLIIYDQGDDEIYVDLQLPAGIKPNYAFPVGVTTGRVLVADDWDVTGTILVAKTTSGDVIKLLYGDDGTLRMDNGTGLFKQIYFKSDVDAIITTLTTYINTELAKKQDKLTAGTGINISQNNEISNTLPGAVVSATAPSNPSQGAMWYDTTTDTLMTYDGSQWNATGGGGSGDVQVSTDTGNLLTTGVKLWLGDKADFDNLGSLDSNTIYAPIEGRIVVCDFTQSDCGFIASRHHDGVVTGRDSNGLSMYCTQDTYKGASWTIPSNIFSNGALKKVVLQLYANNTGCGGGIGYNLDSAYSRVWWQGNMCDWTGTVHTESLQSNTPANTAYTFTIDLENGQQWTSLEPEAILNLTSGEVSAITTHWNNGEIGLVGMLVRSSNSDIAYIQKARFYF